MRKAVVAIRDGGCACRELRRDGPSNAAAADTLVPPWVEATDRGRVVLVLPGHAGAGASTVAIALAEGLAQGRKVQLVEYAEPFRSGLASASSLELGAAGSWRRGRRGGLEVLRRMPRDASGEAPPLPEGEDADRWVVVDAGADLATAWLASSDEICERVKDVVVATRLTVPAVRQTEQVLQALGGQALVVALGPSRWPRTVEATCGPRLRDLRARGRVICMPIDRRLATAGLTGDPLPTAVAAAGRSLAALLAPQPQPRSQHGHRRQAVSSCRGPARTDR